MTRVRAIEAAKLAGSHSAAAWAACETLNSSANLAARAASQEALEQIRQGNLNAAEEEEHLQACFLRDIAGNPFHPIREWERLSVPRPRQILELAEELSQGGPQEGMRLFADILASRSCPPTMVDHFRSAEPHVRGCWALDLILRHPPETSLREERALPRPETSLRQERALPRPTGIVSPTTATQIRTALQQFLGSKKFRRTIRLALGRATSNSLEKPDGWFRFVQLHPDYDLPEPQLLEVLAFCPVHFCDLERRLMRIQNESEALLCDGDYLQARANRFPFGFALGDVTDPLPEVWWCSRCQRDREEWFEFRGKPADSA